MVERKDLTVQVTAETDGMVFGRNVVIRASNLMGMGAHGFQPLFGLVDELSRNVLKDSLGIRQDTSVDDGAPESWADGIVNPAQKVYLDLARLSSFNNFDGGRVTDLLLQHRNLWKGMTFGREYMQGIILRDIDSGFMNADTMWITVVPSHEDDLVSLVEREFDADEIDWMGNDRAGEFMGTSRSLERTVLRVWWD